MNELRDPPASASQVLGLKAWATTAQLVGVLKTIFGQVLFLWFLFLVVFCLFVCFVLFCFFETRFPYVALAVLELTL